MEGFVTVDNILTALGTAWGELASPPGPTGQEDSQDEDKPELRLQIPAGMRLPYFEYAIAQIQARLAERQSFTRRVARLCLVNFAFLA